MRKLLCFAMLLPFFAAAQSTSSQKGSTNITVDTLPQKTKAMLVIPFEPKMYMCQVDKEISMRNNLTYEQITEKMRDNLSQAIAFKTDETMESYQFYSDKIDTMRKDLHYLYTSVEYAYQPLPGEKTEATATNEKKTGERIFDKFPAKNNGKQEPQTRNSKPPIQNPDPGTRIENGQIVSVEDDREKFMDVTILNKNLLSEMSKYYGADHFLFINQLDIIYSSESTEQLRIKVHYSYYDISGKKLTAGAVTGFMPVGNYDLSVIKNDYFYPLAIKINDHLKSALGLVAKP